MDTMSKRRSMASKVRIRTIKDYKKLIYNEINQLHSITSATN